MSRAILEKYLKYLFYILFGAGKAAVIMVRCRIHGQKSHPGRLAKAKPFGVAWRPGAHPTLKLRVASQQKLIAYECLPKPWRR